MDSPNPEKHAMTDSNATGLRFASAPNSSGDVPPIEQCRAVMVVEGLSVYFNGRPAVADINLRIPQNAITGLIGPSGSGKTTLLRALNRMHDRTSSSRVTGKVTLGDLNVYDSRTDPVLLRSRIGMVFQRPNPFPNMNIYQNVVAALRFAGVRRKGLLDEAAESALIAAGLWDEVKDRLRSPAISLSGGQQQRVCIARALAIEPEMLLMDEPTSALDPSATLRIEQLIVELADRVSIVIVTHNMQQAARVSQYCAFLLPDNDRAGRLVEVSSTKKLFSAPSDSRTDDYICGRFG
jgi:phosphate transport system ATP-binding protein